MPFRHLCGSIHVVAVTLTSAFPLTAQASPGPRAGLSSPIVHRDASLSMSARDSVPPSQWTKGMLIGAGVGVLATGFFYELGVTWATPKEASILLALS